MFTECPECEIAFRVTAKVLQQANGNVRCGGCNHAFNALEYLSEEMPGTVPTDSGDVSDDELAETSRRLLKTLDELAGPNEVRIEDTGIEWRVLEENLDADDAELPDEMRYDDNTPLPDEFDEGEAVLAEAEPQPAESTDASLPVEFTESHGEAALTEPDEWTDLLDEVCQPEAEEAPIEDLEERGPESESLENPDEALANSEDQDEADDIQEMESEVLQIEEELAAIHTQLLSEDDEQDDMEGVAGLADIDTQFNMQADALGLDRFGTIEAPSDENPLVDESSSINTEEEEEPAEEPDADDIAGQLDEDNEFDEEIYAEADADAAHESEADIADDASESETEDADHGDDIEEEPAYDDADDVDDETPGDAEDEASAEAEEEQTNIAASGVDDEYESLAARNESTSEFEAQIDAAASAFADFNKAEYEALEEEAGEDELVDDDEVSDYAADSNDISLDFLALENQVSDDEGLGKKLDAAADESDADEETGETEHFVPQQTDEEMTVNMEIDQEMMALALQDDEFSATLVGMATPDELLKNKADDVEAIIMEGEFVRNAVEQERISAEAAARSQLDDAGSLPDSYVLSNEKQRGGRRDYDPPAYGMIAGVAVLGLALLAQFVHYSRETLATSGSFNQTIGTVYRLLGNPVTPEWDIKGWQFETTNGNIGETDNSLVIVSRLINQSDADLPYPLVHVSLTDRWEDIMGSRVLEPGEYLAGTLDPGTPVSPSQSFTAVITIENPATEATGFKLNVCYRQEPGVVRCAIEDFK